MKTFIHDRRWHTISVVAAVVTLLGAPGCSDDNLPIPPPATSTAVAVTVIDGAIGNAQVCLDINLDHLCGPAEPVATTNAAGQATLDVPNNKLGKFPVIAVVGTDAIDAEFGAVSAPFVLSAPAEQPAVISPLTTLVQARIESASDGLAAAETYVTREAGLLVSPLANYTLDAGSNAASTAAASLARLVVLTQQRQLAVLAPVVGTSDISNTIINQGDIDRIASKALLEQMPALDAATRAATNLSAADREASLAASAQKLVADQTALTAANAAAAIGADRISALPDDTASIAPTAGYSLMALSYTDAANWFYRVNAFTAADKTPSASGQTLSYAQRSQSVAGVIETWGNGSTPSRATDSHWSGTDWRTCPLNTRTTAQAPDANGWNAYDFCEGYIQGRSRGSKIDIGGQSMSSVIATIRGLPGSNSGVDFAQFGPVDLAVLGDTAFPVDSKLEYKVTTQDILSAPSYDTRDSGRLFAIDADIAIGGDARANPALACGQIQITTPPDTYRSLASSFEQIIERNHGTPCIFDTSTNSNGSSLPTNEWWSQSTVSIATMANAIDLPAGTGNYYTRTVSLRLAFADDGHGITWYQCLRRTIDTSARNCTALGTGQYTVQTLGDARVMSFSQPPLLASSLSYLPILIERGGFVWSGFQVKANTAMGARLNTAATSALFSRLGIPEIVPN